MARSFLERLKEDKIILFDGATGTLIQQMGIKINSAPEMLNLTHPNILQGISRGYIEAGCEVLETNTFGANRIKLKNFGLEDKVYELNFAGIKIIKEIAPPGVLVAASIGPLGKFLRPIGEIELEEAIDVFSEQVRACLDAGADLIIFETFLDLAEIKAAIIAAKNISNIPVIATMTFQNDLRTVLGTSPEIAAIVLESMDVAMIGANCSLGPDGLVKVAEKMLKVSNASFLFQPNAGLPILENGKTLFPATPKEMAVSVKKFISLGAKGVGGCCGTTPEHLKAMAFAAKGGKPKRRKNISGLRIASRTKEILIGDNNSVILIGERINPTGKKALSQELMNKSYTLVRKEAIEQANNGAQVLDINVGVPGIDEPSTMKEVVRVVQTAVDLPVMIDSATPETIEAGLASFCGKAIINSVSGEEKKLKAILPLAKKYGAAILGLALDENGIPQTAEGKLLVAKKIMERALDFGISKNNILIDCIVSTISAQPDQALETLKAIRLVKERLKLPTILGVSNISHGLPNRSLLNATFFSMAISYGLDAAIINPYDLRIQETLAASSVLTNKDKKAQRYIEREGKLSSTVVITKKETGQRETETKPESIIDKIYKTVVEGEKDGILELVEKALEQGMKPWEISNNALIPALEKVGEGFQGQELFLPQVLLSAETMQVAFQRLKKEMTPEELSNKHKVLMATVEGDVHDIGKNIVSTLLLNHGFEIIDIGKNVPADIIIEKAIENNVSFIGLSALMTTTIMEMEKVIRKLKERNLKIPVIIGGAVVTQSFADKIGASLYAKDALQAVEKLKGFLQSNYKKV